MVFVLLLGGLLFVPLPKTEASASEQALRDALHFPLFVILSGLVYFGCARLLSLPRKKALLVAVLVSVALAGVSELAQTLTSRTSSAQDLLYNLLGILCAAVTITAGWQWGSRRFLPILSCAVAVWICATIVVSGPMRFALHAERSQERAFPLIGDFEHGCELIFWIPQGDEAGKETRLSISNAHTTSGNHSLKVELNGAPWCGVQAKLSSPLPWSASQRLSFDLFNPGAEFKLGIRIDGASGARFSAEVLVATGPNECRIPPEQFANRDGPLTADPPFAVRTIVFHLGKTPSKHTFHLDRVRLEEHR